MKTLFENKFISTFETDEGYVFSHDSRCNGQIVAILPFIPDPLQFLIRFEVTPCHQNGEIYNSSITGGVENDDVEETAIQELEEEAGLIAEKFELINIGIIYPSKSQDTVIHLFGLDITGKEIGEAMGDGSLFETLAYCKLSSNIDDIISSKSPLNHVMLLRLMRLGKIKPEVICASI